MSQNHVFATLRPGREYAQGLGQTSYLASKTAHLNVDERRRAPARVAYYLRAMVSERVPWAWHQKRFQSALRALDPDRLSEDVKARARYLNRMGPTEVRPKHALVDLPRKHITYFIDFMEHARGFGPDAWVNVQFGDVTAVPSDPTFVKSRPIGPPQINGNSVVLKLNHFRHFQFVQDRIPFRDKAPTAVWRGRLNKHPSRIALIDRYGADHDVNIGLSFKTENRAVAKPFLSIAEQLQHRYVISLEGFDVATNLKWIFGSNALCLAAPLRFETWFQEGLLQPGVHFAPIASDCSDLKEVIAHYNDHPDEAEAIIRNANAWARRFTDPVAERQVAQLVLARYFQQTAQIEPGPWSAIFDEVPQDAQASLDAAPAMGHI